MIRVYFYDKQRLGNYQIKVGKKTDMLEFNRYLEKILRPLNSKITHSTREPLRRYYVEWEHIDYMMKDPDIDLKPPYVWRENKREE